MRSWLPHAGTFLLGLTLAVVFYEGRRLVVTTADALSAVSSLEELPERPRTKEKGKVGRKADPGPRAEPASGEQRVDAANDDLATARVERHKAKRRRGRGGKLVDGRELRQPLDPIEGRRMKAKYGGGAPVEPTEPDEEPLEEPLDEEELPEEEPN